MKVSWVKESKDVASSAFEVLREYSREQTRDKEDRPRLINQQELTDTIFKLFSHEILRYINRLQIFILKIMKKQFVVTGMMPITKFDDSMNGTLAVR